MPLKDASHDLSLGLLSVHEIGVSHRLMYTEEQPWTVLSEEMMAVPAEAVVTLKNPDRQWELVSAYQKAVRRSDLAVALKVVEAISSQPQLWGYLWRRLMTTAAEDIGPANPALVNFVIACGQVFRPSAKPHLQYPVIVNLTRLMCDSPKDHSWCSWSEIETRGPEALRYSKTTPKQVEIAAALQYGDDTVFKQKEKHPSWNDLSPKAQWIVKNNWRGEGMLQYQLYDWVKLDPQPVPEFDGLPEEKLFGLPEYAYDMHTRVGQRALVMLTGNPKIKEVLAQYPPTQNKMKLLGTVLFYVEGGTLKPGTLDWDLIAVERATVFGVYGYDLLKTSTLADVMLDQMRLGVLTQLRDKALREQYP